MFYFLMIGLFIFNTKHAFANSGNSSIECTYLLEEYSTSVADFTKCSILNAKPIHMCQSCVNEYILTLESFKNLSKVVDNGTACVNNYINLDRLAIFDTIRLSTDNLWSKAGCNDCFSFVNETLTPIPSEVKMKFDSLYNDFESCWNEYYAGNETVFCKSCLKSYLQLNNYYFGKLDEEMNGFCMDVVDKMNSTQKDWSDKCCKYRRHNEYIFIVLCSLIGILPIIFYGIIMKFRTVQPTTLLIQNRFAESIQVQSQNELLENS